MINVDDPHHLRATLATMKSAKEKGVNMNIWDRDIKAVEDAIAVIEAIRAQQSLARTISQERNTMTNTAYEKAILARDNDRGAARRTADQIVHLLRDFIPEHCFRDAWERIAETADKEGWELTSRAMRKEYEAWKSTRIEGLHILPAVPRS